MELSQETMKIAERLLTLDVCYEDKLSDKSKLEAYENRVLFRNLVKDLSEEEKQEILRRYKDFLNKETLHVWKTRLT